MTRNRSRRSKAPPVEAAPMHFIDSYDLGVGERDLISR